MEKVLAVAFLVMVATAGTAAALDINLQVHPDDVIVKPRKVASFVATVESDIKDGGISIFVTGKPSYWINMGTSFIDLPYEGQIKVPIEFYPNDVPGTYEYVVTTQSTLHPEIKDEESLTLVVLSSEKLNLLESSMEEEDGSVVMEMLIDSEGAREVTTDYSVVDEAGRIVATYTTTEGIEGRERLVESIPTSGLLAGEYVLVAKVKNSSIEVAEPFGVNVVRNVEKTEEETAGTLFEEYRINLKNEGNVVEDGYRITSSVPTGFVTFSHEPESCEDGTCEWVIPSLGPKENLEITYRIDYWPLIAEGLLIAVLLGAFVVFGWNRVNVPSISKKVKGGKEGNYTAVLEIRNAGRRITNVVVRDFVSPLFEIQKDFESVKPAVKPADDGTELVWTLPAIEPGDHRIIHYKMKPVVNGHLRIPKAQMRYVYANGKKSRIESKGSFLAA